MNINVVKRFEIKLIIGILLIDLMFVLLAILFLVNSRAHYQDLFNVTGQNLARLLKQGVADKVRLIDDAIVRVERELHRQLTAGSVDTARLEHLVEAEQTQLPEIEAIRVTNSVGDVLFGKGVVPGVHVNYADQEFFKNHRGHTTRDFLISEPILDERSGGWILAFTRCYHSANNQFSGIVTAAVPVDTFGKLLATVDLGRTDTVVLRNTNMGLIARVPSISGPAGLPGNRKASDELARVLESGVPEAVYRTAQTPDFVERTYSFRRVSGAPFTIAVGLDDQAFQAPWRNEALWVGALLAIFLAVTTIFTWMTVSHLRDRSAMEKLHNEDMTRLRILVEQSRDGIVVIDHQGKVWESNKRFAEMLGYTPEEIQQLHVWDWDAQWTREQLLESIDDIDAEGYHFETYHRRKDGTIYEVEITTNGVEYAGRKMVFCVCRDITERKLVEKNIRENEQRLRTLINSTPDIICFKDGKGRWLEANDADLDLFSLTGVEYRGKTDAELADCTASIYRQDFLACEATDEMAWQAGCVSRGEEVVTRVDGTSKTYDIVKVPIFDADGSRKALVVLGRDITERKQVEEEKKKLQEQLLQSQKMEAIGTLAGGIAHDFNNILGAIIGFTEVACDCIQPESIAVSYLDKVLEASHRASGLVKQILAFSRQTASEHVPIQPAILIKEDLKFLRPLLPSTIAIKQQIDTATKPILVDPIEVHQVLMNLCTNAFHAMERTGGTLEIFLKNTEFSAYDLQNQVGVQPGNFAELSIRDTGPGIPLEIRERIFDPYFTTKEVGKGTGMGLAIVHGIIKNYGGFITCESISGNGAVFKVFFPTMEHQEAVPINNTAEVLEAGGGRILFVDDEEILADLGRVMLERLGYEVVTQTSSQEAWVIFQSNPDQFDAVITDQTMPSLTGCDLARRMLQIRPDLPIILCTGYSSHISEDLARSFGIKGFAMKPLIKKDMASLLRTVLDS